MVRNDPNDRRAVAMVALAVTALVAAGCSAERGAVGDAIAATPPSTTEPSERPVDVDVVTVTGVGTAEVVPDAARVTIAVEVVDASLSTAFDTAAEAADAVIAAVQDAGIAEDGIRTTGIDVRAERERPEGPDASPDISGYLVRHALDVTIDDADQAGAVLAAAAEAGGDATRVGDFELVATDDADATSRAREAAFAEARATAADYAELAGRSLGPLHTLTESGTTPPPEPLVEAADVAAPPAEAGTLTVTVAVRATFYLE